MKKHIKRPPKNSKHSTNLVAKHAHRFNKAIIFADKSKYRRKAKHRHLEPFFMQCIDYIKNGSNYAQLFQQLQKFTTPSKNTILLP